MEQKVQEAVAVHSVEIEHMKKDIDHIMAKVDKMDTKIDNIEKMLSEINGGRKAAMWMFGGIGAVGASILHWFFGK